VHGLRLSSAAAAHHDVVAAADSRTRPRKCNPRHVGYREGRRVSAKTAVLLGGKAIRHSPAVQEDPIIVLWLIRWHTVHVTQHMK